eukprot:SM000039S14521  [mRNA]  locus=s39:526909:528658:- [translate_table: standard]
MSGLPQSAAAGRRWDDDEAALANGSSKRGLVVRAKLHVSERVITDVPPFDCDSSHAVFVVTLWPSGKSCGTSFEVAIVSPAFEGQTLLKRHRLINDALKVEMADIHALSIRRALTPQQWADEASKAQR